MADPLLTTLCAICHAQTPKYTCPACHTHTCSLPCTQRHKAWSSCTGRRDPTAFLPITKLKTPAGIDHDYNFLSAIERARERTQRDLLGGGSNDRAAPLFTPTQLGRDLDGERRWRREWFGEEVRFVSKDGGGGRGPTAAAMGSDGEEEGGEGVGGERTTGNSLARKVRSRLDALGIEVVRMPVGMTRQRENTTAWNRRAGRINWCVEWFVYDCPPWPSSDDDQDDTKLDHQKQQAQKPQQPLRIRHKALESRPLYRALGDSLAWHHKGTTKTQHDSLDSDDDDTTTTPARKRRRLLIKEIKDDLRRTTPQDPATGAFAHPTPYATQNPYTGAWAPAHDRAATVRSWLGDEVVEGMRRGGWRFYLLRAPTPAGRDRELIPCGAEESLGQALRGRTVVEFPTVYVLPPSLDEKEEGRKLLPPGFVLGSTERRAPVSTGKRKKQQQQQQQQQRLPKKRKAATKGLDAVAPNNNNNNNKRQRGGGGGSRGRGGRVTTLAHREREEGEVVSGEEGVAAAAAAAAAADTTSSDPDTSSDEEDVDVDVGVATAGAAVHTFSKAPAASNETAAQSSTSSPHADASSTRLGALVGYGSDSSDEEDEENVTNADLASLKPEDPELVAGAIQEIVGLLT